MDPTTEKIVNQVADGIVGARVRHRPALGGAGPSSRSSSRSRAACSRSPSNSATATRCARCWTPSSQRPGRRRTRRSRASTGIRERRRLLSPSRPVVTPRTPDGLWSYLGSGDVAEVARHGARSETIDKLLRAGCVGALPMIEVGRGHAATARARRRRRRRASRAHLSAILASFPSILGSLSRSFAHWRPSATRRSAPCSGTSSPSASRAARCTGRSRRSTPPSRPSPAPRSRAPASSCRAIDVRGREVWLQLEQQTSTATIADVLDRWPTAVCITGCSTNRSDPRTLDECVRPRALPRAGHPDEPPRRVVGGRCPWPSATCCTWALATWAPRA